MGKMLQNLIRGAGSLIDIQPAPHRSSVMEKLPSLSDAEAIEDDWLQVGQDIATAIDKTERQRVSHGSKA